MTYDKMRFNGIIRIITVGYLKQSISISTVLIQLRFINWKPYKIESKFDKINDML